MPCSRSGCCTKCPALSRLHMTLNAFTQTVSVNLHLSIFKMKLENRSVGVGNAIEHHRSPQPSEHQLTLSPRGC